MTTLKGWQLRRHVPTSEEKRAEIMEWLARHRRDRESAPLIAIEYVEWLLTELTAAIQRETE